MSSAAHASGPASRKTVIRLLFFKINKICPNICPEECETFTPGLSFTWFILVWTNEGEEAVGRARHRRRQPCRSGPQPHAAINSWAPPSPLFLCDGLTPSVWACCGAAGSSWGSLPYTKGRRRPRRPALSSHGFLRVGISGPYRLRGPQSRAEQDELPLQTRVSDASMTPLFGTDPAQVRGDLAGVVPASADALFLPRPLVLAGWSAAPRG